MKKEVSCINTRAILEFVKEKNHGDCSALLRDLDPEIDHLPDLEGFLKDQNNWISSSVATKLYQRASSILNNDRTAYEIARYAVEKISLGYAQRIVVKALWSYKHALKHAQKINDRWNRTKRVEVVEVKGNEAVVRLHWERQMDVTKDYCLMNQGTYTFMPLVWGGRPLRLEEACCYFDGAPYCEYRLKWPARNRLHEILSRFFTTKSVLTETIREMEEGKRIIEQKYEEVNELNVALNRKISQLIAIQETGKAILSVLNLDQLLAVIMNILSRICRINRAIIMLVNEQKGYLEYIHGVGFDEETLEAIRNYRVPLHRVSNMLVRVTSTGRSEYIAEVRRSSLKKENILLVQGKPISAFVVPLITRSKVIGVIATDAIDGRGVPEDTRETLELFAPQIAIAIENARLYSSLQASLSDLKNSRALLSRAERFSFLGNLAARLAHEIKNPLTAIGTFIQLLPLKYEDPEFREDFHKIAMEETARVNNLITELLDLVRPRESNFGYGDIHALIEKMTLLVSPRSKAKQIAIIRNFDESIGEIWMDGEKIKQVILNLLSNAIDFCPQEGGRIEVSTKNHSGRGGRPRSIRIEVKDNGVGVPPALQEKIFEPYFTTKHKSSMHSGTGLGLFIAHQNMQDHGGTIEVKSTPNLETTFILTLPAEPPSERETNSDTA